MQQFEYAVPVRAPKLYDEILAAIPACAPVDNRSQLLVESTASWCQVTVPDTVAQSEVDAVVAAHDPTTPSPIEEQQTADQTMLQSMAHDYQVLSQGLKGIKADLDVLAAHAQTLSTITITGTLAQTQAKVQSTFQSLGSDLGTMVHDIDLLCNGSQRLLDSLDVYVRHTTANTSSPPP